MPSSDYMVEKLGIEKDKIVELSNLLYKNYGTTMAGLRVLLLFILFFFPTSFFMLVHNINLIFFFLSFLLCRQLVMTLTMMSTIGIEILLFFIFYLLLLIDLLIFLCNSYVHGRLPYENLKPDPQLRSLLLTLPLRKIVSS